MKKEDMVEINLNAEIYVKLQENGVKFYRNHFLKYHCEPPKSLSIKTYTKFQLWEFMEIFGPVTSIGFQDYYLNTIRISKKDVGRIT